jgi:hypothetical protein
MPVQRLEQGLHTLRELHARIRMLLEGGMTRVLDHDDYGYAGWFIHLKTPALCEIARQGWVERHLHDFALLAESPALGDCCRATVVELFGVEAFHVAIQHYPVSDGLVKGLCHGAGDKVDQVRRITGQLINLRLASGSYPPPGMGLDNVSSVDRPAVDAIPVG